MTGFSDLGPTTIDVGGFTEKAPRFSSSRGVEPSRSSSLIRWRARVWLQTGRRRGLVGGVGASFAVGAGPGLMSLIGPGSARRRGGRTSGGQVHGRNALRRAVPLITGSVCCRTISDVSSSGVRVRAFAATRSSSEIAMLRLGQPPDEYPAKRRRSVAARPRSSPLHRRRTPADEPIPRRRVAMSSRATMSMARRASASGRRVIVGSMSGDRRDALPRLVPTPARVRQTPGDVLQQRAIGRAADTRPCAREGRDDGHDRAGVCSNRAPLSVGAAVTT